MSFSYFSFLPPYLTVVETWIVRIFVTLTLATILPWFLFIAYDIFLYLTRRVAYEIPVVGGRANGQTRPRRPTLGDRAGTVGAGPGGLVRVLTGGGRTEDEMAKEQGDGDQYRDGLLGGEGMEDEVDAVAGGVERRSYEGKNGADDDGGGGGLVAG